MYKNIFLDLDGTVIDSKKRLFQLFTDLTLQTVITFEEYWICKRSKESNADLLKNKLGYGPGQINQFMSDWMMLIEDEQYLKKDTLFKDTVSTLEELKSHADLYIVTARQFSDRANKQLSCLGIDKYFKKILVTEQKKTKADLMQPFNTNGCSIIIGDTGEDTLAGKKLKMITANVLTGFRNKEVLKSYSPDHIFDNLDAFCKKIDEVYKKINKKSND